MFHVKIKTFDTQKLEIKLKNFRPSMYMFSNFVEKLLFFVIILYYKFYYLHVIGLFHQKNLKSLKISDFFYFSIKGLYQPITYQSRIFHRLHRFYVLCMHLIGHIKLIGNDQKNHETIAIARVVSRPARIYQLFRHFQTN